MILPSIYTTDHTHGIGLAYLTVDNVKSDGVVWAVFLRCGVLFVSSLYVKERKELAYLHAILPIYMLYFPLFQC